MKQRLCVIVPAYNESEVIYDVIKTSMKAFKASGQKIDLVVVNDGSIDATAKEARRAGAIVIDHILNSGAGGATATGLSYANQKGYRAAATMDADGQHDPQDVIKGFKTLLKS